MFSRLALRAGAATPLLRSQTPSSGLLVVAARGNSALTKKVDDWEKANKIYYGPERDTTNFPILKQPERPPPTKLGFIPETWLNFFYAKTGVTGPYMFGTGVVTYLLSKEWWVVEHGFTEVLAFWIVFYVMTRKFGPKIGPYLDDMGGDHRAAHWDKPLAAAKDSGQSRISSLEQAIWQEEGQSHLFDSKRENVDLQLESVYRQRLAQVTQAVKKRLDYQMEVENTTRTFQQQHMVKWIVDNVVKSITPQQEKESITKCIQDLKVLSLKTAAA